MASDQQGTAPSQPPRSAASQWRLWVGVTAVALLLLFLLQNLQKVTVHFLWMDWSAPLSWALLVSALAGAAAVFLAMTVRVHIRRRGQDDEGSR